MSNVEERYSIFDFLLFLLAMFSAGEIIVVVPIILYRMLVMSKQYNSIRWFEELFFLCVIFIATLINFKIFEQTSFALGHGVLYYVLLLKDYLKYFVVTIFNRLIFLPFLGNLTVLINRSVGISIILGVLILVIMYKKLVAVKKSYSHYHVLLLIVLISQISLILLTVFARPDAASTPFLGVINGIGQLNHRYMFFVVAFAVIFWQVFISELLISKDISIAIRNRYLIFLSLYVIVLNISNRFEFSNFYHLAGVAYTKQDLWDYNYPMLDKMIKSGDPKTVTIPLAPDPKAWKVEILSKHIFQM